MSEWTRCKPPQCAAPLDPSELAEKENPCYGGVSHVSLKSCFMRTLGEVASDLPPLSNVVVEDDASLVHADAAESLFASEP